MAIFGPNQQELGVSRAAPFRPTGGTRDRATEQLVSDLGTMIGTGLEASTELRKQEAESQKSQVATRFQNDLLKYSRAVRQGKMSSTDAKTRMNIALSEYSESFPELSSEFRAVQKDVMSTAGMGQVAAEGTQQEQRLQQLFDDAQANGALNPLASEEDQWAQVQDFVDTERSLREMQVKSEELNLMQQQFQTQSAERQARIARTKEEQRNAAVSYAQGRTSQLRSQMQQIVEDYESNQMDADSATNQINQLMASTDQDLRQNIGTRLEQDFINSLMSPIERAEQAAKKVISGEMNARSLRNEFEAESTSVRLGWYEDPQIARVVEGSRMLQGSPVLQRAVSSGMSEKIADYVMGFNSDTETRNPFPDNPRDQESFQEYINQVVTPQVRNSNLSNGEDEQLEEEIGRSLRGVLQGVSKYSDSTESITEFQTIVNTLASDSIGRWMERNQGLPGGIPEGVDDAIDRHYTDEVKAMVRDEWQQATTLRDRSSGSLLDPRFGAGFGQNVPESRVKEALVPEFKSGSVRFSPRMEGEAGNALRDTAEELNQTVAPVLNKLVKMTSHLEGHRNYRQAFEQIASDLFPTLDTDGGNDTGGEIIPLAGGPSPVDRVFRDLATVEGEEGDEVTDIPTGELGVTDEARGAVPDADDKTDREIARDYLELSYDELHELEGFSSSSDALQEVVLDASYNMGVDTVKGFSKLRKALKEGDEQKAAEELLDTAARNGKALRGLAKRRAMAYNRIGSPKIKTVEQQEDGTIIYKDGQGNVIKQYNPGEKHEDSGIGSITVPSR